MLVCITRWEENNSHFEDYKIIGKEIPEEIAVRLVELGYSEIVDIEEEGIEAHE